MVYLTMIPHRVGMRRIRDTHSGSRTGGIGSPCRRSGQQSKREQNCTQDAAETDGAERGESELVHFQTGLPLNGVGHGRKSQFHAKGVARKYAIRRSSGI